MHLPVLIACRALPQAPHPLTARVVTVDYEALLIKYIARIIDNEGIDYIDINSGFEVDFTKEEKEQLEQLSKRAVEEYLS